MKRLVALLVVTVLLQLPGRVHASGALDGFTLTTIQGKVVDFRALQGKPVVVVVSSHMCTACKDEALDVEKAYRAFKDKGVQFVGAFVESDDAEIKEFIEKYHWSFPVGKENGLARRIRVSGTPTNAFIDRQGRIAQLLTGAIDDGDFASAIESLLK